MSLEVKALKFLIWSGLANKVGMVRRLAGENVPWLKYYSDSVLSGPGENMRLLRQILATRAADSHLQSIDLTFGAPEFHPEWADGFDELADQAFHNIADADEADTLAKYPPPLGHPELKSLLAKKMEAEQGEYYDAQREVLITNGASNALSLALRRLRESGRQGSALRSVVLHVQLHVQVVAGTGGLGAYDAASRLRAGG